ncbi:hypothetical protein [Actinoplanes solisilvae]|uniref:hypothetical protein n=1 Tax=Actinoplanes solisilvae TaxID=2486853 RepID=UPI000FDCC8D7|nr:hypothetical protein [Actinoplanes solisilvae]
MTAPIPSAEYSTAPPWVTPELAPVPVPDPGPHTSHGRLLVRFPEEMARAARPTAPSWAPVVFWTLLAVVPGLISATRRGAEARRGGNERYPYWIAFGTVLATGVVTFLSLAPGAGSG